MFQAAMASHAANGDQNWQSRTKQNVQKVLWHIACHCKFEAVSAAHIAAFILSKFQSKSTAPLRFKFYGTF